MRTKRVGGPLAGRKPHGSAATRRVRNAWFADAPGAIVNPRSSDQGSMTWASALFPGPPPPLCMESRSLALGCLDSESVVLVAPCDSAA
jgi:hypothetical protein